MKSKTVSKMRTRVIWSEFICPVLGNKGMLSSYNTYKHYTIPGIAYNTWSYQGSALLLQYWWLNPIPGQHDGSIHRIQCANQGAGWWREEMKIYLPFEPLPGSWWDSSDLHPFFCWPRSLLRMCLSWDRSLGCNGCFCSHDLSHPFYDVAYKTEELVLL